MKRLIINEGVAIVILLFIVHIISKINKVPDNYQITVTAGVTVVISFFIIKSLSNPRPTILLPATIVLTTALVVSFISFVAPLAVINIVAFGIFLLITGVVVFVDLEAIATAISDLNFEVAKDRIDQALLSALGTAGVSLVILYGLPRII